MQKTKIEEPLDLVKLCLDETIVTKLRGERKVKGRLRAFDQHFNLLLSDVTEEHQAETRTYPMLFVRGDLVVMISPLPAN